MDLVSAAIGAAAIGLLWALAKAQQRQSAGQVQRAEEAVEEEPAGPSESDARELLHKAAVITNETRSTKEAFRRCVEAITQFTGWSAGFVYVHRPGPYRATETSILFEMDPNDPLDPLRRLIRAARPTAGRGVMGKALATRAPVFRDELDASVAWMSVAQQHGYRSVTVFPVQVDGEVRALLLFFTEHIEHPDQAVLEIVEGVAAQLSRVLEREGAYKANADLAAIVETTSDAVIGFSPDGVVTSWNPGAERLYGFTADEVLGGPLFATIPKSREKETLDILDRLARGKRVEGLETERVHKDGQRIDVSLTASPIVTPTGEVIGASSIERDITDRKQAARRLARYRTIVNSSDDAIIGVTYKGRVLSCNPAAERLFGHDAETLMGKTLEPLVPADRPEELARLLQRTRDGEHIQGHETIWLRKDGMPIEVALTVSPIVDAAKRVQGAVIAGRDITLQKRTERNLTLTASTLERSNAELETFAYVVSHDLKAPMRAIRGLSEWVEADLDAVMDDQTREHMSLLRGRVKRMEGLLNGLLEYSRAGRLRAEPEDVNCRELVNDVVALITPPEGFDVVIASEMPTLTTPRAPLRQVIQNLVENAIKHHHSPGGRVEVACSQPNGEPIVTFSVSDDGPGIDAQYHERIFEIFQTLKRRDEVEGTGMGLAIVTKVVQTFGGGIEVESAPGAGTTFRFTWPRKYNPQAE